MSTILLPWPGCILLALKWFSRWRIGRLIDTYMECTLLKPYLTFPSILILQNFCPSLISLWPRFPYLLLLKGLNQDKSSLQLKRSKLSIPKATSMKWDLRKYQANNLHSRDINRGSNLEGTIQFVSIKLQGSIPVLTSSYRVMPILWKVSLIFPSMTNPFYPKPK